MHCCGPSTPVPASTHRASAHLPFPPSSRPPCTASSGPPLQWHQLFSVMSPTRIFLVGFLAAFGSPHSSIVEDPKGPMGSGHRGHRVWQVQPTRLPWAPSQRGPPKGWLTWSRQGELPGRAGQSCLRGAGTPCHCRERSLSQSQSWSGRQLGQPHQPGSELQGPAVTRTCAAPHGVGIREAGVTAPGPGTNKHPVHLHQGCCGTLHALPTSLGRQGWSRPREPPGLGTAQ